MFPKKTAVKLISTKKFFNVQNRHKGNKNKTKN